MSSGPATGIVWNDDRTQYYDGSRWISASNSSTTSSVLSLNQEPAPSQHNPPQDIVNSTTVTGPPLGENAPTDLASKMVDLFSQSSPQDRQVLAPNGPYGTNPQTPGLPVTPTTQLDPRFRAAASSSQFIRCFVLAHDKIARGQVP